MNQFKTFQDIEDFLLDYNKDGTPIKDYTYICKSTKKKSIRIYKHIKFKIFCFIILINIIQILIMMIYKNYLYIIFNLYT